MINFAKCFFFTTVIVTLFSSCGKLKTNDVKTIPDNVNPNTAKLNINYNFNDTLLTDHGWTKIFEDNFSTDLSQWNVLQGGVQKELECYQTSNVSLANGILSIAAKRESVTGPAIVGESTQGSFNFSSGWIVSKRSFSLSQNAPKLHIVGRIKVASGVGLTSFFYTFGGNWPTNGEIDFMQVLGTRTDRYFSDYAFGTQPLKNLVTNAQYFNPTDGNLSSDYHVFELEWSATSLNTYLDGKLVEVKLSGGHIADLFGKTEYLSMNLPVGGLYYPNLDASTVNPGVISVDYIKVFSSQ
jgi:beta-glucanase (GH16 family)